MKTVGSRAEVWHGTAKKTSGGLLKKDLKKNKRGRIVSKKMSNRAKKEKRLEKAGYKTKKGVFKKFKAKKKGGMKRHSPKSALQNYSLRSLIKHYSNSPRNAARAMAMSKELKYFEHNFNKNLTEILNKHGNIDKALIESVRKGNKSDVKILLNARADKDVKDKYDMTSLHWAAEGGHTDIVKLLLDAGADKNVKDKYDDTPLHIAADKGHTDSVKLLLDAGADKDVKNENGLTPLFSAALKGHTDVVKLLLDVGADKDMKYKYFEFTPLHGAAQGGHTDIVKLLLDYGADKDVKNKDGKTPQHYAAARGRTDIVNLLKSHNSKGGSKKRRKRKTSKRKTTKRKSKK